HGRQASRRQWCLDESSTNGARNGAPTSGSRRRHSVTRAIERRSAMNPTNEILRRFAPAVLPLGLVLLGTSCSKRERSVDHQRPATVPAPAAQASPLPGSSNV